MAFDDATGGGTKSFVMSKLGPMPVWAWGLAGLGAAIAYASWRKNKAAAATPATDPTIPADNQPPVVFQSYTTILDTDTPVPPGAGRQGPPVVVPPGTHPPAPPPFRVPAPTTPVLRTPAPTPAPASGTWVTVAKYTSNNPAWNSTLWGIAQHFGLGSSSTNYAPIWNNAQNAALKARRKVPTSIQPGDRIFVPA